MDAQVRQALMDFGRQNPKVLAIYTGQDPEAESSSDSKRQAFYIIPQTKKFDNELEDKITELDLMLFRKLGVNAMLCCWPCNVEHVSEYGFIHKEVYRKN